VDCAVCGSSDRTEKFGNREQAVDFFSFSGQFAGKMVLLQRL
jgi:hypothetical protein